MALAVNNIPVGSLVSIQGRGASAKKTVLDDNQVQKTTVPSNKSYEIYKKIQEKLGYTSAPGQTYDCDKEFREIYLKDHNMKSDAKTEDSKVNLYVAKKQYALAVKHKAEDLTNAQKKCAAQMLFVAALVAEIVLGILFVLSVGSLTIVTGGVGAVVVACAAALLWLALKPYPSVKTNKFHILTGVAHVHEALQTEERWKDLLENATNTMNSKLRLFCSPASQPKVTKVTLRPESNRSKTENKTHSQMLAEIKNQLRADIQLMKKDYEDAADKQLAQKEIDMFNLALVEFTNAEKDFKSRTIQVVNFGG